MVASTARSVQFISQSGVRARVLAVLSGAVHTPTEIAVLENKHLSHVSRALSELETRGLVEVARSDSRERYYRATKAGYSLFQTISQRTK